MDLSDIRISNSSGIFIAVNLDNFWNVEIFDENGLPTFRVEKASHAEVLQQLEQFLYGKDQHEISP